MSKPFSPVQCATFIAFKQIDFSVVNFVESKNEYSCAAIDFIVRRNQNAEMQAVNEVSLGGHVATFAVAIKRTFSRRLCTGKQLFASHSVPPYVLHA
ncbi:hypothetical protein [Paraburkholderia fungorum]|uniref:hypothetical protein n=1 Tax=Paraburkholderia fungorum TaxID=134537 RepID=UPI0020975CF9|nr:hypothetical protein [Paraburkholderia fungorum]USX08856.1 hypothetical protein NHH62_19325 [Paraburkholderia fungorum]